MNYGLIFQVGGPQNKKKRSGLNSTTSLPFFLYRAMFQYNMTDQFLFVRKWSKKVMPCTLLVMKSNLGLESSTKLLKNQIRPGKLSMTVTSLWIVSWLIFDWNWPLNHHHHLLMHTGRMGSSDFEHEKVSQIDLNTHQ